jgi:glycosyltransferase involved in cell wall biosynthesis
MNATGIGHRIYAICLVKNEDDIITQTLSHAAGHCEKILVLDNGSTDRTWELVQSLSRVDQRIVPFGQTLEPYRRSLRAQVYYDVRSELSEDDWWLILDSDEFLAEDPQLVIRQAVQENANVIRSWQVTFYFTDVDLRAWEEGEDSRDRPIVERRRYYRIDWQERRLFRNRRDLPWGNGNVPGGLGKECKRRIFNRHYLFRDPPQIEKRLSVKREIPSKAGKTPRHWQSMVKNSRKLDFYQDGDPWRFRLWPMTTSLRWRLSRRVRKKWDYAVESVFGLFGRTMSRNE